MDFLNFLTLTYPFSGPITMPATDSVWYRCLAACLSQVQGLGLDGINTDDMVLQKLPWARAWSNKTRNFPGLIICPWGSEEMNPMAGVNRRDDVGYPVLISLIAQDNEDLESNLSEYLLWREQINRFFRNQRLTGVPEIIKTVANPLPVWLNDSFSKNIWHSSLSFRFYSREVRGVS